MNQEIQNYLRLRHRLALPLSLSQFALLCDGGGRGLTVWLLRSRCPLTSSDLIPIVFLPLGGILPTKGEEVTAGLRFTSWDGAEHPCLVLWSS